MESLNPAPDQRDGRGHTGVDARRYEGGSARSVVCILNQPDAGMGRFRKLLIRAGFRLRELHAATADFGSIDVDEVAGVISLGGAMSVHDVDRLPHLDDEMGLLRAAHARGVPLLGVCLGSQLLAAALGAPVYERRGSEAGWVEVDHLVDDLLLGPQGRRLQLQRHYDSFELPAGAERIATSASCRNQAFRYGRSYGIQFHPEVSLKLLASWVFSPGGRAELREAGVDPDELVTQGRTLDGSSQRQAETMIAGFTRLIFERE
jgi:GMP synthase (glutamine-hydrolysing)